MAAKEESLVIQRVMTEQNQGHETRQEIFKALEQKLGRPVVSFFTSFRYPVMIENADADMLEGVLQKMTLYKWLGFAYKFTWRRQFSG